MALSTVAILGRPNTGKSTLFNRLVGSKISIIEDTPGVTRDRIYSDVTYKDQKFHLIDTGGIDLGQEDFNKDIIMQASLAIDESELVLFVIDGKEPLTSNDLLVRDMLRNCGKEVIVVINKMESFKNADNVYDYYELGFEHYISISAEHNINISQLKEEILEILPNTNYNEYDSEYIKFCLIGRPNVGKSSLINALLNEERVIVSDVAGTTRDSVDTTFNYEHQKYVAIDTAGMRKRGRIYENIEKYSLIRAMKSIERSDVAVIILNKEEGIIEHDKHIVSYALEAKKALVLVVNKWDLANEDDIKSYTKLIKAEFKFIDYVPIVFLSALTKKRLHTLMPQIIKAHENSKKEIKTSLLNQVILDAYNLNLPPSYKGKRLKIYFSVQTSTMPPKFDIQVNSKGLIHFSYKRYLENKIRENFDFTGTPIDLNFKNKGEKI